jgi:cellulose synthase/poly-beta-1,6-N-acetylglucosamine synthase-like glycosyltransferase
MYWLTSILIIPYFILLLKIYRSLSKIQTFCITSKPATFVSVIVAYHNEQENLNSLIKSLNLQDYPEEFFEVIMVDDNSTDNSYEIVSSFTNNNIISVKNKGKGKKQAIRTGISASSGLLIITTDADCLMGKKWISTIASFFEIHKPDMILCPVQIEAGKGFFRRFQELEFMSLQGVTAGSVFFGEGTMCNGANLAFTKKVYQDHSENLHYEIASGDDIFLLHSVKEQAGTKILWLESNDAMVTAGPSPTTMSFLKQRKRWISKGKAYNDQFTNLLSIVTFVTICLQVSLLLAGFFNPELWWLFLTIFLIKSLPDFLILQNRADKYGRTNLMLWFLPSQIIYPFYVLGVVLYVLIVPEKVEN